MAPLFHIYTALYIVDTQMPSWASYYCTVKTGWLGNLKPKQKTSAGIQI